MAFHEYDTIDIYNERSIEICIEYIDEYWDIAGLCLQF